MKSNQVRNSFFLCLTVILMLGLLSVIPPFHIDGFEFRRIDLLSGIRTTPENDDEENLAKVTDQEISNSKTQSPDSVAEVEAGECKPGVTCIEDFSKDKTGTKKILKALSEIRKVKKPVRIAFYGDSFIEGDVFCGSVRDTLQSVFGGRGVGFVPITSHITGFRSTIKHDFENWQTYSIVSKKDSLSNLEMGPAGYCFKPLKDNWVEYKVSKRRFLRDFAVMKLFYKNPGNASIAYTINDTIYGIESLNRSKKLVEWTMEDRDAKEVQFEFENADSLQVFGASFEDTRGIYVDNFAMRGNSGIGLAHISDDMFKSFNKLRDYKLVLLQYGLNVVNDDSSRYKWYAERMITVINKIKEVFPGASIVLVSVSDRSTNIDGSFKTEKSVPALRNVQREIAQKTGIAFWDLYSAMGGKDSMVKFVSAKPALAAKDYTHLTFTGGKKLAGALVKSLLFELEKYEQKSN